MDNFIFKPAWCQLIAGITNRFMDPFQGNWIWIIVVQ